jgi:hypothetical protein
MRLRRTFLLAAVVIAVGLSIAPVRAHHSFAPYETTLQMKLTGVVTEFRWVNPHVYIQLDGIDAKSGEKKHWLVECASTSILNRAGWRFNMIKAGDMITVVASPLRNGDPGALLKQITLADGRKFTNGAAAGRATIE